MRELNELYCSRCGSEFDIRIRKTTGYSGPLHIPNLFCPFCGSRRVVKRRGIFFGEL
ncbi:hypothetical protein [Geoglobus acetivorans]